MTAKLINGNEVAQQIREELKQEVTQIKEKHNVTPGLVTILVERFGGSVVSNLFVKRCKIVQAQSCIFMLRP